MDLRRAVRGRRSIRKFIQKEVPQELIREILEDALWAPSWGNTQPWEFYVVTGDTVEGFKKANRTKFLKGEAQSPDVPMPGSWPDTHKERYAGVGKSILEALSIGREDLEARKGYYADMFHLFDAPCLILICIDKRLSIEYAMLDVGLITQTICLLAYERGLGTCMLANSSRYPELLREMLPIPERKNIVIGTALGYPDLDSPVNHFERNRAELEEVVRWVN
ncbi:MAG: nitroreductase [Desulfobacteraceae bacterium]|jgi:nitroreductase